MHRADVFYTGAVLTAVLSCTCDIYRCLRRTSEARGSPIQVDVEAGKGNKSGSTRESAAAYFHTWCFA